MHTKNKYQSKPDQEKKWAAELRECLIRHLARTPALARKKLKTMDRQIKRNAKGDVDKKSISLFLEMEKLRNELNTERLRLKNANR